MTTATIIKPHEQIIRKAEAELAVLDRTERETRLTVATIEAETSTIQARIQARASEMSTLFETAAHFAAEYDALVAQQKLAIGTLQEGKLDSQVKASAKEKEKSERALATLEARIAKEDGTDSIKLQALSNERASCRGRLDEISRERQALVNAKDAAQRDMGESVLRDVLQKHQAARLHIAMLEEQLAQSKEDMAQIVASGVQQLARWPDLQQQVKALVVIDDATTRILEQAAVLYGSLLDEGEQVTNDANLLRQVSPWLGSANDLLVLQPDDLWPFATHRPNEALTIRDRKQQLLKLLELYRQQQKEAGTWRRN